MTRTLEDRVVAFPGGVHRGSATDLTEGDGIDISLVVPTRNEAGNIDALVEAAFRSLLPSERSWELIFVDDSDDDTPEVIERLAAEIGEISLIHRLPGHRHGGLASAVTEGYAHARGEAIVVMDGDLQHPPEMARRLAAPILNGESDLVIASRYVTGASAAGLSGFWRRMVSSFCTFLVHLLVPASRGVKDPLSGFFAVSREKVAGSRLRPHGFKILLEVLARTSSPRVMEVPFQMRERGDGESKAGVGEGFRFARHLGRLVRPRPSTAGRAVLWAAAQLPLAAILAVQFLLSQRLIYRNTAFVDEATYLSAGHYLLHVWFHPSADMHFPTYFSGAPTIYPPLAALANNVGGLAGGRYLSLGFMIIANVCLYASAKRLWGRPSGWLASGLFVTTQGVQFLGSFATYDAMSLMLMAVAAWLVIRFAARPRLSSWIYLSVAVLVFANATKYASAIFDAVVLGVAFFVVAHHHGFRNAVRVTATMVAFLVIVVCLLLAIVPHAYLTGITSTTTNRASANTPASKVLDLSWSWIGFIGCVAALAAVIAALRCVRNRHRSWSTAGLVAVCAVAVWLAPLNQARIDTATSLSKHVTFGAWFGALAGGWLFHWMASPRRSTGVGNRHRSAWPWWLYLVAVAASTAAAIALIPPAVAGTHQANYLDHEWPNSSQVVAALRPLIAKSGGEILMDNGEVARYYLEDEAALPRWVDTFYYAYTPPGTDTHLTNGPAYAAAIEHGQFSVIAIDFGEQIRVDRAIAQAIHDSKRYAWVGDFTGYDTFGRDSYVVWRLKS